MRVREDEYSEIYYTRKDKIFSSLIGIALLVICIIFPVLPISIFVYFKIMTMKEKKEKERQK